MLANWKKEFTPLILSRGKKYYEDGAVERIRQCEDGYYAYVAGSEDYQVEIALNETGIEEMACSCPYAKGNYCKHMAAVLYAIEAGDIVIEKVRPAKKPQIVAHVPMEMPWLEAIDHLPEDVVRKELLKLADRDGRLRTRLGVMFLKGLPQGQIQNWKADLQASAAKYANRWGCVDFEDAWDFLEEAKFLLRANLPMVMEVDAVEDAFGIIWIVMETALEWALDNCDDELDELFEECDVALQKLWFRATESQREKMLQWYRENRDEQWPGSIGRLDMIFEQFQKC